jgi:hypothetical protein
MRIVSIRYLCSNSEIFENYSAPPYIQSHPEINKLFEKWIGPTKLYIKQLWNIDSLKDWSDQKKNTIKELMEATNNDGNKNPYSFKDIIDITIIKTETDYIDDLSNGIPIRAHREDSDKAVSNYFEHTRCLLHSLLVWIFEKCQKKSIFLSRDPETGSPILNEAEEFSPFLFDNRGGTFTHDPETRREYFQFRAALMLSLIDLSTVIKKDILLSE